MSIVAPSNFSDLTSLRVVILIAHEEGFRERAVVAWMAFNDVRLLG
jgi:hypothetical protein